MPLPVPLAVTKLSQTVDPWRAVQVVVSAPVPMRSTAAESCVSVVVPRITESTRLTGLTASVSCGSTTKESTTSDGLPCAPSAVTVTVSM